MYYTKGKLNMSMRRNFRGRRPSSGRSGNMPSTPPTTVVESAINGTVTESSANTINYSAVEVPLSQGAQSVRCKGIELDVAAPDTPSSGDAVVEAGVFNSKTTPTSPTLGNVGVMHCARRTVRAEATSAAKVSWQDGGGFVTKNYGVRKYDDDKWYVTVAVRGTGNSAVKAVTYRVEFESYF